MKESPRPMAADNNAADATALDTVLAEHAGTPAPNEGGVTG